MPDTWKFHTPVARLYAYIYDPKGDKPPQKVRTPQGTGILISALGGEKGCRVQLDRTQEFKPRKGKAFRPTTNFSHDEIEII